MKLLTASLCFALAGLAGTLQSRADAIYDWTGGQSGYAGTVVLDSSSNAAGSWADIVSIQVITPDGTFFTDQVPAGAISGGGISESVTWNTTQITSLEYFFEFPWTLVGEDGLAGVGANVPNGGTFVLSEAYNNDEDTTGAWLAAPGTSIPDTGSTLTLVLLGLGALAFLGVRKARRPLTSMPTG